MSNLCKQKTYCICSLENLYFSPLLQQQNANERLANESTTMEKKINGNGSSFLNFLHANDMTNVGAAESATCGNGSD